MGRTAPIPVEPDCLEAGAECPYPIEARLIK
jgi:hypothetical protein